VGNPRQPGQLVHLNALRHDERETRRAEAWAMRIEGRTVRTIAERLSCSISTAHEYLRSTLEELKECSKESADGWRRLELDRLDAIIATWSPISSAPSHPEATRAAAIVVRAIEGQSRLLGLLQQLNDAPAVSATPAESIGDLFANSPALREAAERLITKARAASPASEA
jgi:hypothetical protein